MEYFRLGEISLPIISMSWAHQQSQRVSGLVFWCWYYSEQMLSSGLDRKGLISVCQEGNGACKALGMCEATWRGLVPSLYRHTGGASWRRAWFYPAIPFHSCPSKVSRGGEERGWIWKPLFKPVHFPFWLCGSWEQANVCPLSLILYTDQDRERSAEVSRDLLI